MIYDEIIQILKSKTDEKFKAFNKRIINTRYETLGVRTPDLVKIAKITIENCPDFVEEFLLRSSFTYDELFISSQICIKNKDYETGAGILKKILPRFENWSIVDQTIKKDIKWVNKNIDKFFLDFSYLKDDDSYFLGEFYRRTYIMMLFSFCINDERIDFLLSEITTVRNGEYYVDMAIAWLLCEVLIKFYDKSIKIISIKYFSKSIINKTADKCQDSFRLSNEQKLCLKLLKS